MQQPIRIAVTGTYSSGKTTLANALRRTFDGLASLVQEQPRRVIRAAGNSLMRDADVRSYLVVSQLLRELELSQRYIQISDGSVISNLAHDRLLLHPPPSRERLLHDFSFQHYDVAFVCDHSTVDLEIDGERFTDPTLRHALAREAPAIASSLAREVILLTGSRGERLQQATHHIWQEMRHKHAALVLDKAAGLVISNKKLLVVRKKAHAAGAFIPPGGRLETAETPVAALHREIREELQVNVENSLMFGLYYGLAEFERTPIRMHAYLCSISGEPRPDNEIREAVWMTFDDLKKAPLGSILKARIVPALREQGLI